MDITTIMLSGLAAILIVFLLDLTFLTLILFCLSVSYFIEARIKGITWKDSFYGAASVVLIIVGLIVACFGCFLLPYAPATSADNSTNFQNISSNNSLNLANVTQTSTLNESITTFQHEINSSNYTQNITSSTPNQNDPSSILNALGLGLGVIGVGIALFAYGLGNLTTIESNREFQELKIYVIEGPYFALKFKKKLVPLDYLKIFGFWAIIGVIIVIFNFPTAQSTYLTFIRFIIGLLLFAIGMSAIYYGITKTEIDLARTIQTVLIQLKHR